MYEIDGPMKGMLPIWKLHEVLPIRGWKLGDAILSTFATGQELTDRFTLNAFEDVPVGDYLGRLRDLYQTIDRLHFERWATSLKLLKLKSQSKVRTSKSWHPPHLIEQILLMKVDNTFDKTELLEHLKTAYALPLQSITFLPEGEDSYGYIACV